MSDYDELKRRHIDQMLATMPEFVARLSWSRPQIELHRRRALRLLLRVAKEYSPWYRQRLRHIDAGTATEADLKRIPPMTRDDLMENWDEIVIYPSLRLRDVEAHLHRMKDGAYLLDSFHAVESTGSRGGRRGVFVYDWDGWIASFSGCARWRVRETPRVLEKLRPVVACVAAGGAGNIHTANTRTFSVGSFHHLDSDSPVSEQVQVLNALRPDILVGLPSALEELASETRRGRLAIEPWYLSSTGEVLLPRVRAELEAVWGAPVDNAWSASEALPMAQHCGTGPGLHVSDDLVLLEPVGPSAAPVEPGTLSSGVLLTNLFNLALPLIRYELSDRVKVATDPCSCGSAHTHLEEVQGATASCFEYEDGVTVDPEEIGSILARERDVLAYQVHQTEGGVEVWIRSEGHVHLRAVGQRVASALGKGGVEHPSVSVRRVESIEREPTGKLRRYVPRAGAGPPPRSVTGLRGAGRSVMATHGDS